MDTASNVYYVYALYTSFKPNIPFYIGKGKGHRVNVHFTPSVLARKTPKYNYMRSIIDKGGSFITKKLYDSLSENAAHLIECDLIKQYGRRPSGPLFNFTDGGDGTSGRPQTPAVKAALKRANEKRKGKPLSEYHRKSISSGNTGKKRSAETRAKMGPICANNSRSDTAKAKNRAAHLGKKHTEETRRKMSIAKLGKPKSPEWAAKISASNIRTKALKRMLREGKCK